jgi:hypothetical protein
MVVFLVEGEVGDDGRHQAVAAGAVSQVAAEHPTSGN